MDLKVIETLNGGDLVKNTKDLAVVEMTEGLTNMPYLAMFGGNIEESTPDFRLSRRQYFDWWGNVLLLQNAPTSQFNSETERVLNSTPLTSAGRVLIEEAIKKDLSFLREIADVSVSVSIISDDRIAIGIKLNQNVNLYIWDATRSELEEQDFVIISSTAIKFKIFDDSFDLSFE